MAKKIIKDEFNQNYLEICGKLDELKDREHLHQMAVEELRDRLQEAKEKKEELLLSPDARAANLDEYLKASEKVHYLQNELDRMSRAGATEKLTADETAYFYGLYTQTIKEEQRKAEETLEKYIPLIEQVAKDYRANVEKLYQKAKELIEGHGSDERGKIMIGYTPTGVFAPQAVRWAETLKQNK